MVEKFSGTGFTADALQLDYLRDSNGVAINTPYSFLVQDNPVREKINQLIDFRKNTYCISTFETIDDIMNLTEPSMIIVDCDFTIATSIVFPDHIFFTFLPGCRFLSLSAISISFFYLPSFSEIPFGENIHITLRSFPNNNISSENSTPITLAEPSKLIGAGEKISAYINKQTNGNHFISVISDDVTIENIDIDGSCATQSVNSGTALVFGSSNVQYKNVKAQNCKILANGFDGLGLYNIDNGNSIMNTVTSLFDTGIDLVEGTKNSLVFGNTAYTSGSGKYGIFLDSYDFGNFNFVRDNILIGNHVTALEDSNLWQGVGLGNTKRNIFLGNIISTENALSNSADALKILTNSQDNIISSSMFRGKTSHIGLNLDGTTGQALKRTMVSNCCFFDPQRGIQNYYSDGLRVSGSLFHNCGFGIDSYSSSSIQIQDMCVSNSSFYGNAFGLRFAASGGSSFATVSNVICSSSAVYDLAVDAGWNILWQGKRPEKIYSDGTILWDVPYLRYGTSSERPNVATAKNGDCFFDTTLMRQVVWNGVSWITETIDAFTNKQTGWATSVGTPQYGGFDASTVSLQDLAKVVLAIQHVLESRNIIGS